MSQDYGIPSHSAHVGKPSRAPGRYLVVIDSAGSALARLFLASRVQVEEFDGGAEEVASMTRGLVPARGADAAEWDTALRGHNAAERTAALVYTLAI